MLPGDSFPHEAIRDLLKIARARVPVELAEWRRCGSLAAACRVASRPLGQGIRAFPTDRWHHRVAMPSMLEAHDPLPLDRFRHDSRWTPIKGMYINPLRVFADRHSRDPNYYLEVIKVTDVAGTDVAVTRGGGLFVRDRGQYNTVRARYELASLLNLYLAELALEGIVSHPATDGEMHGGKLIGRHASICGGGGSFPESTWGPHYMLEAGVNWWTDRNVEFLERVEGTSRAIRLRQISSTLPTMLLSAAYHAIRHDVPATIVTAWIVCEEIVSSLWDSYVCTLADPARRERRDRLSDTRTYSAAVRVEVLLTAGQLPEDLCACLHRARQVRNKLAHRAAMDHEAAQSCYDAMREILNHIGVASDRLPSYSFLQAGPSPTATPAEPEFPFR